MAALCIGRRGAVEASRAAGRAVYATRPALEPRPRALGYNSRPGGAPAATIDRGTP